MRAVVKAGMRRGEENRYMHKDVNRENRKQKSSLPAHPPQPTIYICHKCGRDSHARVGLISHSKNIKAKTKQKMFFSLFLNIYLFVYRPLHRFIFYSSFLFIYVLLIFNSS